MHLFIELQALRFPFWIGFPRLISHFQFPKKKARKKERKSKVQLLKELSLNVKHSMNHRVIIPYSWLNSEVIISPIICRYIS